MRTVPNDQQRARHRAEEQAYKSHDILGVGRSRLHLHEEPSLGSDASESREMIARQLEAQHRSLPASRRGSHDHRQQRKACLIDTDDRAFFLFCFFCALANAVLSSA